jgi:hypothetical protein
MRYSVGSAHHYSQREIYSEVKGNFFGYFGDIFEKSLWKAHIGAEKNGKPLWFGVKRLKKKLKNCVY